MIHLENALNTCIL